MNKVETQYTNWVYPLPVQDMQKAIADGSYTEIGDPMIEWPRFWPNKRGIGKLDVLIAGCGTNQAAYYACRNPNWNVTGIDLSDSSLEHQKILKNKHNLTNLILKKLDLLQVQMLNQNFDLIVSSGVLHHLPDPNLGLNALKEVLRTDGVMNLMVYGASLRLGVYMMQNVFRELDFKQSKEDVDLVRLTIASLHPNHAVKRYTNEALDLKYDAGIVDTFLHPQDKPYYVDEIFALTRDAGLEFISWLDPLDYSLEAHIPLTHPLWNKLKNISKEKQAHICDLLVQGRGVHRWVAGHPDYAKKIVIPEEFNQLLQCSLILNPNITILEKSTPDKKVGVKCKRYKHEFEISHHLSRILEELNGTNSIKDVIDRIIDNDIERVKMYQITIREVKKLYDFGHLYIRLNNV